MKAIVLLSGGIDSPVAAYVMASAGVEMAALHMDNIPFTDGGCNIQLIIQRLREVTGQEIPLYVAPHGKVNLQVIGKTDNSHIRCVLCKRFMLRVAEALADMEDYGAIVMGDSLGQVASQTLRNLLVEQDVVTIPVLRPLIGFDKEEIVSISKEIGTYGLSTENASECLLVPDRPSTHARLDKVSEAEGQMNVKGMVSNCLADMKRL